jgi:uncharacterized protein (DUF2141 family)
LVILGAISALLLQANAAPPATTVDVHVEGMRSQKGLIRACLTHDTRFFPHCEKDPTAHKLNLPTPQGALLHFTDVVPGDYAVTLIHDENGNAKLDTMLGIPREGVGFSNNPRLIAGPPSFAAVRFAVNGVPVTTSIRLKYFL